mgnify:CR=1 FL=1
MKINGKVVRKLVAPGSKSEHDAVMIVTDEGEFILRRSGGNPFADPELDKLVGKQLQCEGTSHGQAFIMTDWSEVKKG